MCEVTNLSTDGNLESFEVDFEDCNANAASFTINLEQDNGNTKTYRAVGINTNSASIDDTAEIASSEAIDPEKVFWAVYRILKDKLCPTCS